MAPTAELKCPESRMLILIPFAEQAVEMMHTLGTHETRMCPCPVCAPAATGPRHHDGQLSSWPASLSPWTVSDYNIHEISSSVLMR